MTNMSIVLKGKRVLGYEMGCRLDLVNVVAHRQDIHCHIHVRTGMRED